MNDSGDHTRRARPIDPAKFRALGTGVGHTAAVSAATGAARAQRVSEAAPPEQLAACPPSEGRPAKYADQSFGPAAMMAGRRWGR